MSCLSPLVSIFRRPNLPKEGDRRSHEQKENVSMPHEKHDAVRKVHHARMMGCCCEAGHLTVQPPSYVAGDVKDDQLFDVKTPEAEESSAEVKTVENAIDDLDSELRKLSLDIHDHPEIMWQEFRTHDVLCDFMESHGFKVTRHAYGLETAWEATFEQGKGGRCVGFNSEMDALPGIGHACGHNLIAIAGVGAALSVAAALKKHDVAGKVVLLGTPAEEGDGGKCDLLKAGAYKQMEYCSMVHPAPSNGVGSTLAIGECIVEYTGHTAHAAAFPWEGVNAQDAAVLAYNNISALRQQIEPTHRVHGIIIGQNWVQNVIPGSSKITFGARCPTLAELDILKVRVEKCFHAGALASGCEYKHEWVMEYYDVRNNSFTSAFYKKYMRKRFDIDFPSSVSLGGSTDFGNVTYAVPGMHPHYAIPVGPGEGNHTVGFTKAAATPEAHEATLEASKGIAVTSWTFLTNDKFAANVTQEFEEMKKNL